MTLSEHQTKILKTSWEEIAKLGLSTIGTAILYQLFVDEPQTVKIFQQFIPSEHKITMETMKSNKRMVVHAEALALSIANVINLLDDQAKLMEFLQDLGSIHQMKGIQPHHFNLLGPVLLKVIKSVLGEAGTDEVIDTWKIAYGAIQGGILLEY